MSRYENDKGILSALLCAAWAVRFSQQLPDAGVFVWMPMVPKTKKREAIRLEMLVVHATTANKAVDPQVRPLMKYFETISLQGFLC